MTLAELLKIIKNKRDNARKQIDYYYNEYMHDLIPEVQGEINAYNDLICLIESKMGKE